LQPRQMTGSPLIVVAPKLLTFFYRNHLNKPYLLQTRSLVAEGFLQERFYKIGSTCLFSL